MVVEGKTPEANAEIQELVDNIKSGAIQRDMMKDKDCVVTMVAQILKK